MFVSSWLDYCNSFLRSLSKLSLHKSQSVQNSVARTESNTRRYTSITPVLKQLHLLPVAHLSVFKTVTLSLKFHYIGFTKYFAPYPYLKFMCPLLLPFFRKKLKIYLYTKAYPGY